MFLSVSSTPSRRKNYPKRTLHLRCDVCNREYTKLYFAHIAKALHHACSEKCQAIAQRKGNALDLQKRQQFIERYGVEHPQQLMSVRAQTRQTNIQRYGCEVSSQAIEVKEKAKQTNRERYGVDWHTQSDNFAEKARSTWLARYGVEHPMQAAEVKAKYDFSDIWQKAHETKKQNGTYASSKAENRFYERLVRLFDNVERQAPIIHNDGKWLIDFKINDVYVQFDGIYWHGLDRPIQMIRESKNIRDLIICKRYDVDRYQDQWFIMHNLRLVRITDEQEKMLSEVVLLKLLTC